MSDDVVRNLYFMDQENLNDRRIQMQDWRLAPVSKRRVS